MNRSILLAASGSSRFFYGGLFLIFSLALLRSTSADIVVYDNTVNNTGSTGVLFGFELADDLHMTSGGNMTSFQFGVVANGSTQATVRFYTNNAGDSIWPGSGSSLLHTETVAISSTAFGLQTVNLNTPVAVPQDMWMSIQFNNSNGQIRLFDPPVVGSSHNNIVIFGVGGAPSDPFGNGRSSFQASVSIADAVPEPSAGFVMFLSIIACTHRGRSA
jgi:hypothetical protein